MQGQKKMMRGILAIVAVCATVILLIFLKPPGELQELEREFGLEVPWWTQLEYGSKNYSFWQGPSGYAVMVYKLRDKDMQDILQTAEQKNWQTLPLAQQVMTDFFAPHVPAEDLEQIPPDLSQGLYKIKEGTYEFRRAYNPTSKRCCNKLDGDEPFSCSLGIIDKAQNKIYLIKWDK